MDESTRAPLKAIEPEEIAVHSVIAVGDKFVADLPVDFGSHHYELSYQLISPVHSAILLAFLVPALLVMALPLFSGGLTQARIIVDAVFVAMMIGMVWLIYRHPKTKVKLSPAGIAFPGKASMGMLGRAERSWDDLHSITLAENPQSNKQFLKGAFAQPAPIDRFKWTKSGKADTEYMLQCDFTSGGNTAIPLDKLTRQQCRCLFLAIESWVAQSKLDKNVIRLKHALISDSDSASYTDIWMQDLEQRYAITNFTPLTVGQRLAEGNYTVVSILSTRGQTAVYLTQDKAGRQLVLKEIASVGPELDQTKLKAREMFHRQAEILIRLHHPQIARVVDCFVEAGRDYLVLEYIPGKTLRQLVKISGPRKVDEIVNWLSQLLDVLSYLHDCAPPIIHRDLTPDNIVLKQDGSIAVIDFGAANEFLGTATGTLVGKQSYVSPEQFRGRALPASDIYSLGATAYFLITGADPIPLTESKASAITNISADLDDFISRCTKLDTTDRLASAEEAREYLRLKNLARI